MDVERTTLPGIGLRHTFTSERGRRVAVISHKPVSPYDGRTLGDTHAHTLTGASIVAVVRHGQVIASPRPDFGFHGEDVVVVVGTADGTAAVAEILAHG